MPAVITDHGRRIVPINAVSLAAMESLANSAQLAAKDEDSLCTKTVDNTVQEHCIVIA